MKLMNGGFCFLVTISRARVFFACFLSEIVSKKKKTVENGTMKKRITKEKKNKKRSFVRMQ